MASPTPQRSTRVTDPAKSNQSSDDECADLRRVCEDAARSAKDLRRMAEGARKDNDQELAWFFECCASSDEARSEQAKELLSSRSSLRASEIPTSAAFAAGDGADDADVSPNSGRGKVGVWPAL